MPEDWEDEDDWEAADLSLPQTGAADAAEWSDEEAHTAEPEPLHPAAAAKPAPPREKTGLEKKIEERELREAAEAAKLAALREAAGLATEIDPSLTGAAADKARRKLLEEAADFDNAAAAFGLDVAAEGAPAEATAVAEPEGKPVAGPSTPAPAPKPPPAAPSVAKAAVATVRKAEAVRPAPKAELPDSFQAKTDQDFEALAEDLNARIAPYAGRTGHMKLLKALLRKAGEGMSTEEAKELSTFASIQYNDKVKADREKDKKGKKTKKGAIKLTAGKDVDNDFGGLEGDGGGAGWRANEDHDFM